MPDKNNLVIKNFYNIFWKNRTCRNIFLLSKEELLETVLLGSENRSYTYSVNKLIISNAQDNINDFDAIKFRNERQNEELDFSMEEKVEYFKPILEDFFKKHLEKPLTNLYKDIESNGWKFIIKIFRLIANENKREENAIKLFQEYGFVGNHLKTFEEIEDNIERSLIPKKNNELINEHTIDKFLEGLKFINELYINHSYKKLYNSNQILVNTLNSEDDFQSRIELFRHLYEGNIIISSTEDAFLECLNCDPGTYKGVFKLSVSPKKLKDFTCPICKNELTYFVPYKLDDNIYQKIKQQDGLLLDALVFKLEERGFICETNKIFIKDIEIDCMYNAILSEEEVTYIVEVKMLKINTEKNKLKHKIRKHYGKLNKDVERLQQELDEFRNKKIMPLLLVNVTDTSLVSEVHYELQQNNPNLRTEVVNLETLFQL